MTSGYQTILNYWENGAAKNPTRIPPKKSLLSQARRTNSSYCTFLPTMVSWFHALNRNDRVVTAKNNLFSKPQV